MLGENNMAVADARLAGVGRHGFMQSSASAAKRFQVIDSQTQGVIVPFREEGKDLVAALSTAHDLAVEFQLLRKAQRFAINVFQWEMDSLTRSGPFTKCRRVLGCSDCERGFIRRSLG